MQRSLIAVAVFCFCDGKVLALRRGQKKTAAGAWEGISGRVEPGESCEAAARRELWEEAGIEGLFDPRPVAAFPGLRGSEPMLVVAYRAKVERPDVCRSSEHDAHAWMTPEEFAQATPFEALGNAAMDAAGYPWA